MKPIKRCEMCKAQMFRRLNPSGKMDSWPRFEARRFCSRRCNAQWHSRRARRFERLMRLPRSYVEVAA